MFIVHSIFVRLDNISCNEECSNPAWVSMFIETTTRFALCFSKEHWLFLPKTIYFTRTQGSLTGVHSIGKFECFRKRVFQERSCCEELTATSASLSNHSIATLTIARATNRTGSLDLNLSTALLVRFTERERVIHCLGCLRIFSEWIDDTCR